MERFFEAWVETALRKVVLRTGGVLRVARRRETVSPISWDPPYLGSQGSLIPDLLLELEDTTLIVDAKYKRHWEDMNDGSWNATDNEIRERHRHDLLQVLAYANLTSTPRVVCCLAYPCTWVTWESLARRGRLFRCAQLPNRGRFIEVWLTGIPMHAAVEEIATHFAARLQAREGPVQEDQEGLSITSMLAGS
jgi:5-methylcytosine-specific restriction endonuclease McrBC regulatory subunit McrC